MRKLIVEPKADEELAAAVDWYEAREPGPGAALLSEVDDAIAGLVRGECVDSKVPGVRSSSSVRRLLLRRFPYSVVFLEHAGAVHVTGVCAPQAKAAILARPRPVLKLQRASARST